MRFSNSLKVSTFYALAICLSSCDYLEDEKTSHQVSDAVTELKKLVHTSQKNSVNEFKKVYQVEYKTIVIPFDRANPKTSSLLIDQSLNDYGQNRWHCYSVEKNEHEGELSFILFLQRPIDTPLRYLPGGIIGK